MIRTSVHRNYRAAENRLWKKVKSLQKLLIRSLAAKFLSIRQVTMENRSKKTPGIDGVVCDTPAKRLALRGKNSSKWVLDADISGCFDNIKHEAILDRTPVFATTIRRWLKSGVIEWSHMQPTEAGTPQGGIISPLLANIALDGLERLFGCTSASGRQLRPAERRGNNKGINLIRYADDFVISRTGLDVQKRQRSFIPA